MTRMIASKSLRPLMVLILVAGVLNHRALAADLAAPETPPNYPQHVPEVGSLDDYVNGSAQAASGDAMMSVLGMNVISGSAELEGWGQVRGIEVVSVQRGSVADSAGMQGEHSALATALTAGFFVAGIFFPPAVFGAALVQSSGVGKSHDLIIAVDGQRTHNIEEFSDALSETMPGELVYLVFVRGGRRNYVTLTAR
jgi:S1-C subfamily serine protease